MLDLYQNAIRNAGRYADARPVQGLDPGFGGAFEAAWRATLAQQSYIFENNLKRDVIDEYLNDYRLATGEALPVPPLYGLSDIPVPGSSQEREAWLQVRERYDQWAAANGRDPFPTNDELNAETLARRQAIYQESQQTLASSRTGGSAFGAFVGSAAGTLVEPVVAGTLVMGAPWASGILRTAMIEAGIGAGSEFLMALGNLNRAQGVDPNYGFGDVLQQAFLAGAGGAVLGGGIKAIAKAWNLVRGGSWPQSVRDAGVTVQREAAAAVSAGRQSSPNDTATVRGAIEQATADLEADRLIEVPPAAADLARPQAAITMTETARGATIQANRTATGGDDGMLGIEIRNDAVYEAMVSVPERARGQGFAVAMYERAIAEAAARGLPFRSDVSISPSAARVWEALERRGYIVSRSPDANGSYQQGFSAGDFRNPNAYVFEVDTSRLPQVNVARVRPEETPENAAARAFGDANGFFSRTATSNDSQLRASAGGLQDAAPSWARMQDAVADGMLSRGLDITPDLMDAIDALEQARLGGRPVADVLADAEMVGGLSETGKMLLRGMFSNEEMTRHAGRASVAAMLRGYADRVQNPAAAAGRMASADEVLADTLRSIEREDLAAEALARTTPEAAEELAESDEVVDAVIRAGEELQIGSTPRMIPEAVEDEAGNVIFTQRSLDEIYDEADAEIAAAGEIEACANGTAAEAAE